MLVRVVWLCLSAQTPLLSKPAIMPKIRTSRTKKPPEGFEEVETVGVPAHVQVVFVERVCGVDPR